MASDGLEAILCPLSGKDTTEVYLSVPDRFGDLHDCPWKLRHSKTGLLYLSPRPDRAHIAPYYQALNYDPFLSVKAHPSLQDRIYRWVREWITLRWKAGMVFSELSEKSSRHIKALDIGCATGDFSDAFRRYASRHELGVTVYGMDVSGDAVRFAREHYEVIAFEGELLTLPFEETMDVITMWHSLEHIHELLATLEKIKRLLAPNGLLVVAMPNPDSFDAHHYKENWVAYDAPRHLYHFTPRSVIELMSRAKLRVRSMRSLPLDSYYNALLSEHLAAARAGSSPSFLHLLKAIGFGTLAAIEGVSPESASSVVYFIEHAS